MDLHQVLFRRLLQNPKAKSEEQKEDEKKWWRNQHSEHAKAYFELFIRYEKLYQRSMNIPPGHERLAMEKRMKMLQKEMQVLDQKVDEAFDSFCDLAFKK